MVTTTATITAAVNAPPMVTFLALEKTSVAVRPSLHTKPIHFVETLSPPASGYQCYRDATNAPKCRTPTTAVPPTLTNTNTNTPVVTYVSSGTTSTTSRGPSTAGLPGTTSRTSLASSPSQAEGNSGLSSSAISVGADALLNLFAGVGVLAYLF